MRDLKSIVQYPSYQRFYEVARLKLKASFPCDTIVLTGNNASTRDETNDTIHRPISSQVNNISCRMC